MAAQWQNDLPLELISDMENSLESLDRLGAQLFQQLNLPVEDGIQTMSINHKSLPELINDLKLKVTRLEHAVGALPLRRTPNQFTNMELYYLIQKVYGPNWVHLMRVLEINELDIEMCRIMSRDEREQKYQMLKLWLGRHNNGLKSCKNEMIFALDIIGCPEVAMMIKTGRSLSTPP